MSQLISGSFNTGLNPAGLLDQQSGVLAVPLGSTGLSISVAGCSSLNMVKLQRMSTPGTTWTDIATFSSDQTTVKVTCSSNEQYRFVTVAMQALSTITYRIHADAARNTGVPLSYLGQVATRAYVAHDLDTTNNSANSRSAHFATQDITSLQVEFPGFYVPKTNAGYDTPTTGINTWTASVEYPAGVLTQIKWAGSASVTAPNVVVLGAVATTGLSDAAQVKIPAGAMFWIKSYVLTPGVTGGGLPTRLVPAGQQFTAGGEACAFSATALGDGTMSATPPTDSGTFTIIYPVAIVAQTTQMAAALIGDSRTDGINSPMDAFGNQGQIAPALGKSVPYISLGVPSTYLRDFVRRGEQRLRLARLYTTHIIDGYGINDLAASVGNLPSAQVIPNKRALASMFAGKTLIGCTMAPGAVTGPYTSEAAQTQDTNYLAWQQVNTWISSQELPSVGVIPIGESVKGLTFPNVWQANTTADGIHGNTLGYANMKAAATVPASDLMTYAPAPFYSLTLIAGAANTAWMDAQNVGAFNTSSLFSSCSRGTFNVGTAGTYSATSFNGGPGYTVVAGSTQVMLGDATIVRKLTNGVAGFTMSMLFTIPATPSGTQGIFGISTATSTAQRGVFTVDAAGKLSFSYRRLDADSVTTLLGATVLPINTPVLAVATVDGTNNSVTFSINGVVVGTGTFPSGAGSISATDAPTVAIGAFNSQFSSATFREWDIMGAAVSNDQRQRLEGDIAWRQGVASIVLPASHPYYSTAPRAN